MRKLSGVLIIGFIALLLAVWVAPITGNAQIPLKKKKVESAEPAGEALAPYPACNGPKKRIAIYRFKDATNNQYSSAIREGMYEFLQQELVKTGCFVVLVTNEDLGDAAAEIAHGQSGMAAGNRSPQAGQQLGAQAIFQGTLAEVAYTGSEGGGVAVPAYLTHGVGGNVGLKQMHAKVVVLVKMFDPETRILQFSERAQGEITKRSLKVGADIQGVYANGKFDRETPLGDAAIRAVHNAVFLIVTKMNAMPWQATVLKVSGKNVIVRAGSDSGLKVGQVLNVYKPGETVEDPDTGEMLQLPATQLGQVKVSEVMEKFVNAVIVSGPVVVGNWVRLE